jgi:hypothetical protein
LKLEAASGHGREDQVALLLTMRRAASAADPCPDLPASFLDVVRIRQRARPLKQNARPAEDAVLDTDEPEAAAEALREGTTSRRRCAGRQVVAWRDRWQALAPLVAAAAWAMRFQS